MANNCVHKILNVFTEVNSNLNDDCNRQMTVYRSRHLSHVEHKQKAKDCPWTQDVS